MEGNAQDNQLSETEVHFFLRAFLRELLKEQSNES